MEGVTMPSVTSAVTSTVTIAVTTATAAVTITAVSAAVTDQTRIGMPVGSGHILR